MNIRMRPSPGVRTTGIRIGKRPALLLEPEQKQPKVPGIIWIHGGGYFLGMKEMVYMSRAEDLVRRFGAVVISPGYRLAPFFPYPAALMDCYEALLYMKEHADALGIRNDQIMVGGESAGGGLAAAVCMLARDRKEVGIAFQMPLYPMLDNFDTDSSRNNHGRIWNTGRNHFGWRMYLGREAKKEVSPYASPARQTDYTGLPPAYSFVGTGEPFYRETLQYMENLRTAGVPAKADTYPTDMHAFDMLEPDQRVSRTAIRAFWEAFAFAKEHYFAPQPKETQDS